ECLLGLSELQARRRQRHSRIVAQRHPARLAAEAVHEEPGLAARGRHADTETGAAVFPGLVADRFRLQRRDALVGDPHPGSLPLPATQVLLWVAAHSQLCETP